MAANILTTIRAEHDVIRALFELLLSTRGNTGAREQLWFRLKTELMAHAWAEEVALYQELASNPTTSDLARHSIEEHETIEELCAQLDHVGFDKPIWLQTLRRLEHVSEHHLSEEEKELFPVAGRVLTRTQKAEATEVYRERKARFVARHLDRLRQTVEEGVDERTYESRPLGELRELARERGIEGASSLQRSELISELRDTFSADA